MYKLFLMLTFLGGCATIGTEIDPAKISAFEKGKTTRAEVEAAIGSPSSVTTLADGNVVAGYMFIHSRTRAATFIPIIGAFAGGSDTRSQIFSIKYDSAGIFQNSTSSIAQSGIGMGLAAGQYQGPQ
jgi:outer membrane protein assembly factor BamE (lipoprotein component of BamABCDE complex)